MINISDTFTDGITLFTTRFPISPIELNKAIHTDSSIMDFGIFTVFAVFVVAMILKSNNKNYKKGVEHGSAKWADDKELNKIKNKGNEESLIISQKTRLSFNAKRVRRNRHVLVIGDTGSGKTRFLLKPNIMNMNSSFVVTDPKGEILRDLGKMLEEQGKYKIKILNLAELDKSDYYNPLKYLRDNKEEDVIQLIRTLILNTSGEDHKPSDPFWESAEMLLLQAIIFYVLEVGTDEEVNINSVLELISHIEVTEKTEEGAGANTLDIMFDIFNKEHPGHIAYKQYKKFKMAPEQTLLSILISVSARLSPYDIDILSYMSEKDTLELDKIGVEKTALFVITSPTNPTFNFIAGIMYTQLFAILDYQANYIFGGELKIPVGFWLDEFANIARIPNFESILTYIRSAGVGVVPIFQSLEQIKKMYKDSWEVVVGSCNTFLFLSGTDIATIEYISKKLGKETIDVVNANKTKGRNKSLALNDSIVGRELMLPEEVAKLDVSECIVFVKGLDPILDKKYDITKHPNFKYTADADRNNTYTIKTKIDRTEHRRKYLEKISEAEKLLREYELEDFMRNQVTVSNNIISEDDVINIDDIDDVSEIIEMDDSVVNELIESFISEKNEDKNSYEDYY